LLAAEKTLIRRWKKNAGYDKIRKTSNGGEKRHDKNNKAARWILDHLLSSYDGDAGDDFRGGRQLSRRNIGEMVL